MPAPTEVAPIISDAVTQTNVKVVAESPAIAMGNVYSALSNASAILFQNAVAQQSQQTVLAQAAANQGVLQIYSLDTMAAAGATEKVGQTGTTDNLSTLLAIVQAFSNAGGR